MSLKEQRDYGIRTRREFRKWTPREVDLTRTGPICVPSQGVNQDRLQSRSLRKGPPVLLGVGTRVGAKGIGQNKRSIVNKEELYYNIVNN